MTLRWLPWIVAAVFGLFVATLILRSIYVDDRAEELCRVMATVVWEGDQQLDGIDYYLTHDDERIEAHQRNERILHLLNCSPLPEEEVR